MKNIEYFLAIDIGASSGRHILGHMNEENKLQIEEIYRFNNGVKKVDNHLCWDLNQLFYEIINGLKKCKELNKIPSYLGIDTWAVDFVLLDKKNNILGNSISYRDSRTKNIPEKIFSKVNEKELYKRTGIQKLNFNTIYQLYSLRENDSQILENAETFLMIPDYFNFLLTGKKAIEYTNATTTQLFNINSLNWDKELLNTLNIPEKIFASVQMAGTPLGTLKKEVVDEIGFDLEVLLTTSHDTASAVLAIPSTDDQTLYLSSGTWSLLGSELKVPLCNEKSRKLNFTNEGGMNYNYRYLKNIMGLWILQNIRKELDCKYSFPELAKMAKSCQEKPLIIDINDNNFLAPTSMIKAIENYCIDNFSYKPNSINEVLSIVYHSLAKSYANSIKELENILDKKFETLHIVGGGCQDEYLNSLTAKEIGCKVLAGPIEATAIGNITAQMIGKNIFSSIKEARKAIYNSFEIKKY